MVSATRLVAIEKLAKTVNVFQPVYLMKPDATTCASIQNRIALIVEVVEKPVPRARVVFKVNVDVHLV